MSERNRVSASPTAPADAEPQTWKPAPPSHDTHRVAAADHAVASTAPSAGADPTTTTLRVGDFFGRYRLEDILGSGGMGTVYRAYDSELQRDVALKVLQRASGEEDGASRRRVLREARAAAALRHPNVIEIYEVGEIEGRAYMAMELLEGNSLERLLPASRELPLRRRVAWLLDLARALVAAHAHGLVHRDIKPHNVLVTRSGGVKVVDFGIAKREGEADAVHDVDLGPSSLRTALGRVVGTPRYMAPEQAAGQSVDGRADQYAWALLACELLIGERPRSSADAKRRMATAGVSSQLANAIDRCLSRDRGDRFETMEPIVAVLERELETRESNGTVAPSQLPWRPFASGAAVAIASAVVMVVALQKLGSRGPSPAAPDAAAASERIPAAPGPSAPVPADSASAVASATGTHQTPHAIAATSTPTRQHCVCVDGRGPLRLCAPGHPTRVECQCKTPEGVIACPVLGCAKSTVVAPAGVGRKEAQGLPCSGFSEASGNAAQGTMQVCGVQCEDPAGFAGATGDRCSGIDNLGEQTEGRLLCR